MKKLLLFALAISFGLSTVAQMATVKPQAKFNTTVALDQPAVDSPTLNYEGISNPYVSNENGSRAIDIVVGETVYDLQSNSSVGYRMHTYDDGTMAAVWTRSMDSDGFPQCTDRGTGYNYFDGTDWGAFPTERVEDVRTGWPMYAPYGDNGEIICSHGGGADGLKFSWRENKGTGNWNYFTLAGPDPAATNELLWPRMITSGEHNDVIHVIACAGNNNVYEGLNMALLYSRSDDGGQTWDPKNKILEGMESGDTHGFGGDDYAWAQPNADVIAFVAFGGIRDGIIMKSEDDGDSWERITFYESPKPFFDGNGGDLPKCGGGDGYNGITIDDDGMVHVAFGRQIHVDDTPNDNGASSYYPFSDGLIYWNEDMNALDTAQIKADILPDDWSNFPIFQNGQLAAWTQPNGDDTIIGVAPYFASLTSMPQLIVENGIVQVFYSALTLGFVDANDKFNYRHIMGRFTEGDGMWSEFTDYTDDVFHLDKECVYPSLSQNTDNNTYHILYQSDQLPGNALQPDPPTHGPVLNNMVYLPVSPLAVDVKENLAQTFEVSQNYPNPVNGQTYFTVTLNQGVNLSLEVYTLTGQVVNTVDYGHKTAGTHTLTINANQLASGVYFYTVSTATNKVTRKMIVQ